MIPWQRDKITALKYRFLTVPPDGLRYTSKGRRGVYRVRLEPGRRAFSTLWLVEGELNAVSLWQALRAEYVVNYDVVSFGSDAKANHVDPVVKSWAGRYLQVIVWADDPGKAAGGYAGDPGRVWLAVPGG